MLRAAADIRLHVTTDKTAKALFDDIVKSGAQHCARRNEIAHGMVSPFFRPVNIITSVHAGTFALFPSYANTPNRRKDEMPTYCYTSVQILHFADEFSKLAERSGQLWVQIRTTP
jgi:hypothetical protein